MRNSVVSFLLLALMAVTLSGCAVAGAIFKGGMAVGIFIAVVVVVLVFVLFGRS